MPFDRLRGRRGGAAAAEEAVARLASGETQVLVGTQMVAKGLDIPNVALVGVVLADIGLHIPDFRAGERVFSLLCQVAAAPDGATRPGRVFVQTYDPEHYAIRAGANQDYSEIYQQEIESRRRLGYPPSTSWPTSSTRTPTPTPASARPRPSPTS